MKLSFFSKRIHRHDGPSSPFSNVISNRNAKLTNCKHRRPACPTTSPSMQCIARQIGPLSQVHLSQVHGAMQSSQHRVHLVIRIAMHKRMQATTSSGSSVERLFIVPVGQMVRAIVNYSAKNFVHRLNGTRRATKGKDEGVKGGMLCSG